VTVLPIVTQEDPILRRNAKLISKITKRHRLLVRDMLETMHDAKNGVGLAAPQVGISERLVVIDIHKGPPLVLINPLIIHSEGKSRDVESCLSIPDRSGYVTRAERVSVTYLNTEGKKITLNSDGILARVLQHEIDHLNGILFIDYIN
jgi:peptide deformylase